VAIINRSVSNGDLIIPPIRLELLDGLLKGYQNLGPAVVQCAGSEAIAVWGAPAVRDLLHISGIVEVDKKNSVKRIVRNHAVPLVRALLAALRELLLPQKVVLILREI
jgi:hypothetical protein